MSCEREPMESVKNLEMPPYTFPGSFLGSVNHRYSIMLPHLSTVLLWKLNFRFKLMIKIQVWITELRSASRPYSGASQEMTVRQWV